MSTVSHPNHATGVYIIKAYALYITNGLPLYIIKPQEDARYRVMIYSPKGADDILFGQGNRGMLFGVSWVLVVPLLF